MKTNIINNLKSIIFGLILAFGINTVVAATFTGPTCAPPGCNTDAPLNVGSSIQTRLGALAIGTTDTSLIGPSLSILKLEGTLLASGAVFNGAIAINDGTQGNGKILVSNAVGLAKWESPSVVSEVKIYDMVLDNVTSKSITFWNPYKPFGAGLQTEQVGIVIDPSSTAALSDNLETRNKLCSTLFPDAPYNSSYTHSSFSTPANNLTMYWDYTNNRFSLAASNTTGMNSIVQWGTQFACSSVQITNVI